ncbi:hypothetical protein JQC92_21315 [Shewanella sp. 202IG2-18]|uniref:hypothetical protein n=1 Tax=Parashewanella hymeniacidonis TaxID=2807618 RepID=UPI0019605881|nr:hypothetical protein [Parashewanella hymeniacidonis]MBM7074524.1 hypothetical protein [Parashewanella hymeniacidonis]
MEEFHISRIHTPQGIYRVSGYLSLISNKVEATSLEVMGTDGWVQLAIERSQPLISELTPILLSHFRDDSV